MENPNFLSVVPPLLAIVLGFVTKQVFLSLFCGIWFGALIISDFKLLESFLRVIDTHLLNSLADKDHASIIIFTLLIGAITSLISRNGGTKGLVEWFSKKAVGTKNVQLMTWFMGLSIFFDDYANSLIVGKSMRPLFDKFKISREKLAFIVDATAAPVSSVALVSTWVSTEIGLIGDAIAQIPGMENQSPFEVFVMSLPYRFYPLLMLFFVFYLIWTQKDFFSMFEAEKKARAMAAPNASKSGPNTDELVEEIPSSSPLNAVIPLVFLVFATLIALYSTGRASVGAELESGFFASLRQIFGNADAYRSMLWSSLATVFFIILISIPQKILDISTSMDAILEGFQAMMVACVVLVLAWALGNLTQELNTTQYLLSILSDSLSPHILPVIVFIAGALISFATGTSWGTMAILMPIAVPLAYGICQSQGMDPAISQQIILASIGSVLAGSVFGDHCSPISDTSVMSASSSDCNLMAHVRTQLPYAVLVAAVGIVVGDAAVGFGLSPFISLILGAGILVLLIKKLGKTVA